MKKKERTIQFFKKVEGNTYNIYIGPTVIEEMKFITPYEVMSDES